MTCVWGGVGVVHCCEHVCCGRERGLSSEIGSVRGTMFSLSTKTVAIINCSKSKVNECISIQQINTWTNSMNSR